MLHMDLKVVYQTYSTHWIILILCFVELSFTILSNNMLQLLSMCVDICEEYVNERDKERGGGGEVWSKVCTSETVM